MTRATVEIMWCPLCREQLTLDWDTVVVAGEASPPDFVSTEHGIGTCPTNHVFDVQRMEVVGAHLLTLKQRRA